MLPNTVLYSNNFYLGGVFNVFDAEAQSINRDIAEIDFNKYSSIEEYLRDYNSKNSGCPTDAIKLSDTLYKIILYPPKRGERHFYVSTLSEEDILKQIKKDRLNSL